MARTIATRWKVIESILFLVRRYFFADIKYGKRVRAIAGISKSRSQGLLYSILKFVILLGSC